MKDGVGSGLRRKVRPRRILFIEANRDSTVGGSPRALLWIIERLNREKYQPSVLFYRDNSMVATFEAICDVHVIDRSSGFVIARDWPALDRVVRRNRLVALLTRALQALWNLVVFELPQQARLCALFWRVRPDIVHLNNGPGEPECVGLGKLGGARVIAHYRGAVGFDAFSPSPLLRSGYQFLCRRFDRIVCISKAVEDVARSDNPGITNLVRIYDGVDGDHVRRSAGGRPSSIRQEANQPPGKPLVGLVNHIRPWKGQHVLVEAVGLLKTRVPELKAVLVGDVSNLPADLEYYNGLQRRVRELGIEERVFFAGYRQDVPSIFDAVDIVVQTSIANEGFGLVTVEAMCLGKPIIGSAFGPTPELITHGENGLVVPPGDPAALADAIEKLVRNSEEACRLGQGARAQADRFSIRANVDAIERLYEELS